ncbi:MAG: prepilin peptidase [Clostridiaceae bacterium]|nr:prepilin peptidase [Clostridiaceae bacterium]
MREIIINCIEGTALVIIALRSDIRSYKIKNKIILTFIVIGVLTNSITHGYEGFIDSFLGVIIPLLLLFILYALKMLGAGDIKLFSALGAVFGAKYIFEILAYSFIAGGIIALILILARKNAKDRILHLYNYLKSLILTFRILPYMEFDNKNDSGKFPFAYAVFFGTIVFILGAMLKYSQA